MSLHRAQVATRNAFWRYVVVLSVAALIVAGCEALT
jgi:anti-sigma-K factor RskA